MKIFNKMQERINDMMVSRYIFPLVFKRFYYQYSQVDMPGIHRGYGIRYVWLTFILRKLTGCKWRHWRDVLESEKNS